MPRKAFVMPAVGAGALFALVAIEAIPARPGIAAAPGQASGQGKAGAAVEWPVDTVTQASLAATIARARTYLADNPGVRLTLRLPAGTFDLSGAATARNASIDLTGIDACPGALVLRGRGIDQTVLVKGNDLTGIIARNAGCLTFADMTFRQNRPETTQGKVVARGDGDVTIDIPNGFPTPDTLAAIPASRDYNGRTIRWIKRFELSGGTARMVADERAVRWTEASAVAGAPRRWRLHLQEGRARASPLNIGDMVGIIAKSGGQAYRFVNGHDITFDTVRWVGESRGKFRRVDRVTVRNSRITPPAPLDGVPYFFATSAGGPQIGHPGDPLTTGHLIENNIFEKTGDDSVALADASGIVRNNRFTDAARGILIVGNGQVELQNNTLTRAPVLRKAEGGTARARRACGPDEDCQPRRRNGADNDDDIEAFIDY